MSEADAPVPGSHDVVAIGTSVSSEVGTVVVRVLAPSSSRTGGPVDMSIEMGGLELIGDLVLWVAVTRTGWAHLRGVGHTADEAGIPFRCDLFAVRAAPPLPPESGDPTPNDARLDRVVVRTYAAGADPDRDPPRIKVAAWLPGGSVRLAGDG